MTPFLLYQIPIKSQVIKRLQIGVKHDMIKYIFGRAIVVANLYYADRIGEIDGTKNEFKESLYLLDSSFHVLGVRAATAPVKPCLQPGDGFFAAFPTDTAERHTLSRILQSCSCDSLLLEAGGQPILMITAFYARTRTLLAVVPEQEMLPLLDNVGEWADILGEMRLQLSIKMLSRRAENRFEEDYYSLVRWLRHVQAPVFAEAPIDQNADRMVSAIAYRLSTTAALCGCQLSYSLQGLGYQQMPIDDLNLLTGLAFPIFMTALRAARDQKVTIEGERTLGGEPMLYASFHRLADSKPFTELENAVQRAATTGETLCIYNDPKGSDLCYIQFSFFPKELSAQEIKHPQIYTS